MSDPINFIVTNAGLNALYDAAQKGIKLSLTKVGLGTGQYSPSKTATALVAKFTDNGISAGGVEVNSFALRFMLIMNYQTEKLVSEIGLYTSTGVLFAVAAKPSGAFFHLYPSIDYVGEFGLALETEAGLSNIEFVMDGRGGIATQLMQDHLLAEDPHPQYKTYAEQLMAEHIAEPDPHPQYALKTFVEDEAAKLEKRVSQLVGITDYLFPPLLECGYGTTENVIANRKKGAIYSWVEKSIVYLFCPEGGHEAWSTTRDTAQFATNVWNRSGTNRVGYAGRSNYAIIDTEKVLQKYGFAANTNQLSNLVKAGVFEAGEKLSIVREAWETTEYTSSDLALLISPEGGHEAWDIYRYADRIDLNIFNRSGTNRIGYSGRVNWALFKADSKPLSPEKYPANLITGVANGSNFTIEAPEGHDFTNPYYLPIITPEGGHEGWSISRQATGFVVNVFNRSGQNRIGYNGNVSWAVFMSKSSSLFGVGTHTFLFKAGSKYKITIVAGGGAGGNSLYSSTFPHPQVAGGAGGVTSIDLDAFSFTALGGKGGLRGVWSTKHYAANGISSDGGEYQSEIKLSVDKPIITAENGTAGTMTSLNRGNGGTALYGLAMNLGAGGKGHYGLGDYQQGYGGSGGGGASAVIEFSPENDYEATIIVGAGGEPYNDPSDEAQVKYNAGFGDSGQNGVVLIDEYS